MQVMAPDERIEAAGRAVVRVVDVGHVVRRRGIGRCESQHFFARNVEKFGGWVDEAPDEPRASDAIDLRALARHPTCRWREWYERMSFATPCFDATGEITRIETALRKRRCDVSTYFAAVHAIDDNRPPRFENGLPCLQVRQSTHRTGDHQWITRESGGAAYIDDRRRRQRRAHQLGKRNNRDFRIHDSPPSRTGNVRFFGAELGRTLVDAAGRLRVAPETYRSHASPRLQAMPAQVS